MTRRGGMEKSPMVTGLQKITLDHHGFLTSHVGPIGSDDVARHMPTARAIHAENLAAAPHPVDASLSPDAHEWAAQRIACNLVALERGFSVERAVRAHERETQAHDRPMEPAYSALRPMPTTAD